MKDTKKQALEQRLADVPEHTINHIKYGELSGVQKMFSEEFHSVVSGKGELRSFSLCSGVTVSFLEMLANYADFRHNEFDNILEINYCRSGRLGWEMCDNGTVYLNCGDFSVHSMAVCGNSKMVFPNEYYEGLMINIDLKAFSNELPELLNGTGITAECLYNKYCRDNDLNYFSVNKQTDGIFNAFFDVPEKLRGAYFKIKVLELLLYLHEIPNKKNLPTPYQAEQTATINQIHEYLMENLDKRITLDVLSKKFLMNTTTLKSLFKAVYGTSVAAHIKEHRMDKAAELLRQTGNRIDEIARQTGYESQSKFTAAFKKFYEITPLEYRKTHSANRKLQYNERKEVRK